MSWFRVPALGADLRANFRIAARVAVIAVLAAPAAGCFQPMFAERADGTGLRDRLAGVEVPAIAVPNGSPYARIGLQIRNDLMFKLYGNATGMPPTHRLVLKLTSSRTSLLVDPLTALPTSENFGIDATYALIENATGKQVLYGSTFSRVTYDLPGGLQRFSRTRAARDSEDRASNEVAENIRNRLSSFFFAGI